MKPEELLSAYDFHLPEELIAQAPVEPRDTSRLLVVHRATGRWEHRSFRDLPEYLGPRDVVVVNNTKVIKARLLGHRLREVEGQWVPGGKVEFLLLEELEPRVWEGMFHAAAKHKPGVRFEIPAGDGGVLRGELIRGASDSAHGTVVARFDRDPLEAEAGVIPLPPYIRRQSDSADEGAYQTVFAREAGSVAAPTAGLHFTDEIRARIREKGIEWNEVTLHVGLGTFRPVKAEELRLHQMHEERYEISAETAERLTRAKTEGKRIVAVGTTSVRTLESAWNSEAGCITRGRARTALFIRPGHFQFRVVDALLTNFHLPRSTLLMLVCALGGRELILDAYAEAVRERYRFFSYGDAMLVL